MRRFLILLRTEFKAWLGDPLPVVGGIIPCVVMLVAFSLMFGGRMALSIAVLDHDAGDAGQTLVETIGEVVSPLSGQPYYDVVDLQEDAAWEAYRARRLLAVWVIPEDFSARLAAGEHAAVQMHFNNYNDDLAKNHRLYPAEILWRFYEKRGLPAPPLARSETYPLPEIVGWFPIIAVGIVLLGTMLGAMVNIFALTHREQQQGITLEFALAPRSLLWIFGAKALFSLILSLLTGTVLLVVVGVWLGHWPALAFLPALYLFMGLIALFWTALAMLVAFRARAFFPGMVSLMLSGIVVFFFGGGLALARPNWDAMIPVIRLFPNPWVVDPVRDLVLFGIWPADFSTAVAAGALLAGLAILASWTLAAGGLRRPGG